jgi:metal-responsive CopG/Arc/MetJ family transcriptional regulator
MASSVKTAISLQKDLFKEVNTLARELHISRSKLFVLAVQDFIKKNQSRKLLAQINKAFDDQPDSEETEVQNKMRNKQLKRVEREEW